MFVDVNTYQLNQKCGLLPRIAQYIHDQLANKKSINESEIKIEISAVDIYCDQVRDLFAS